MENSDFPLLGFRGEYIPDRENLVYACHPTDNSAIYVWLYRSGGYGANIYQFPHLVSDVPTSSCGRLVSSQDPIPCADAFEAQLAINYLIQTHLPTEVTANEEA